MNGLAEFLDDAVDDTISELDRDEAIVQLRDLRKIIGDLKVVESLLVSRVASLMGSGQRLAIPGVGVVEKKSGTVRKQWDHARLLSIVAARAADEAVDSETGEILPMSAFAQLVAERVSQCAGFSYWRVGALKSIGVDANSFCDVEYGLPGIVIRES